MIATFSFAICSKTQINLSFSAKMYLTRSLARTSFRAISLFSTKSNELEKLTLNFINALEHRTSWEDLKSFYHPDVVVTEFPNAITKVATVWSLNDLQLTSEKGSKVFQKEQYDIKKIYSEGNSVILEAIWRGTLAMPIGKLDKGDKVIADCAQFYEYKKDSTDGKLKIYRQRNYDCFIPFN